VITDVRGLRKEVVHIGGLSCACRPISRARSFSRSIRAFVAESSGLVKLLSTASGCATGGGTFGSKKRTFALSVLPDERSMTALATSVPSVSTGTPPIACHVPGVKRMK
jgi:hypothetical protein